jgi:hypothetical protein
MRIACESNMRILRDVAQGDVFRITQHGCDSKLTLRTDFELGREGAGVLLEDGTATFLNMGPNTTVEIVNGAFVEE